MVQAENSNISSHLNLDPAGTAIQGYDPVSYHRDKPEKGMEEYSFFYHAATYLFSSQKNLKIFQENPVRYLPAFGGWCAWAILEGEKISVDPENYKIINSINYLFYNSFFTNTLSKWNKQAERETDKGLIDQAQREWAALNQE
jgi:YHS domain-containing protein